MEVDTCVEPMSSLLACQLSKPRHDVSEPFQSFCFENRQTFRHYIEEALITWNGVVGGRAEVLQLKAPPPGFFKSLIDTEKGITLPFNLNHLVVI